MSVVKLYAILSDSQISGFKTVKGVFIYMDTTLKEKIAKLKKEKNAAILAHYYVNSEVQDIADHIGDSFYLSRLATTIPEETLLVCGVSFMGESVKILNPSKNVILPAPDADCAMAHMADSEKIDIVRRQYDDVAVVCYINSTSELKTLSDVCVTSANALKIVKSLPNKNIFFIPDKNLGSYVASQIPEKHFIFNDGFCPVHHNITPDDIHKVKTLYPDAPVLMHPECEPEVLALADYIGSTSGIIEYACASEDDTFIIATESGVLHELHKRNPDKTFIPAAEDFTCYDMKKITLENIYSSLLNIKNNVTVDDNIRNASLKPLSKMLELSKSKTPRQSPNVCKQPLGSLLAGINGGNI